MDQRKSVVHDGCKVAYWTRGTGPAILFIQAKGQVGEGTSGDTHKYQWVVLTPSTLSALFSICPFG